MPPAGRFPAGVWPYISEMFHVKTRNLPYVGHYAGGHEKGVMGESSRFTHNPFWLRSLKVSFCACSSFGSFGSSCRLRGAGATGSAARCTMESFAGDSLLEACSDFSTTLLKDSATLLAMSESCFATGFHLL